MSQQFGGVGAQATSEKGTHHTTQTITAQLTPMSDVVSPAVWVNESLHCAVELEIALNTTVIEPSAAVPEAVQPAGLFASETAEFRRVT
jgi:hypothetical protein